MPVTQLTDVDLRGKRVLIRSDLNVPLKDGEITNDARIQASLPTIEYALKEAASVILVSHLGRPQVGEDNSAFSLRPVAHRVSQLLQQRIPLIANWHDDLEISAGTVAMLENIRFEAGETKNDSELAAKLARLCDVYINDAFGTAHRAHASTHGITQYVATTCAGLLLGKEIDALERALNAPTRPLVAVLGGAKVSGKLEALHQLKEKADAVLVGGGMANTFLLAAGFETGQSLVEPALLGDARAIRESANLPLPVDVMTTRKIDSESHATLRLREAIPHDEQIVDIGPETARQFAQVIAAAGTVIWNGPMGIFEYPQFGDGTRVVAEAIAESEAFTLAGGGDTIAALDRFGVAAQMDYVSTGGGAFLEFVEGKSLPGIEALQ
ncbi:MAG: phosphoglycerate kinase [Gammaproteobacteria bacterium]|nr:phosphoglycerate kinase [Gammaproteobacteria bacterium]